MPQPYYLQKHLFVCECDGLPVFLDVTRNRYFTLSDAQAQWFVKIFESDGSGLQSEIGARFAEKFVGMNMLTLDPEQGKMPTAVDYVLGKYSIERRPAASSWPSLAGDLPTFLLALFAAVRLRRLSRSRFDAVMRTVSAWKSRLPVQPADARARAIALTHRFHALSPYFFTAHDACFFRSLFLVRYLALHGLAADWVFAVRLCPFRAHCWVEFDHVLLNEDKDRVLEYRPIMLA